MRLVCFVFPVIAAAACPIQIGGRQVEVGTFGTLAVSLEGFVPCKEFAIWVDGQERGRLERGRSTRIRFNFFNEGDEINVQLVCTEERSPLRGIPSQSLRGYLRSGQVATALFTAYHFPNLQ